MQWNVEKIFNDMKIVSQTKLSVRDIYSGHFSPPPRWGGNFLSKLKNKEEFKGGLKKRKNLKKPVIKVPKNREEFRQGGGQFFCLA